MWVPRRVTGERGCVFHQRNTHGLFRFIRVPPRTFISFISNIPSPVSSSCCTLRNIYLAPMRTVSPKEITDMSETIAGYYSCSELFCSFFPPEGKISPCIILLPILINSCYSSCPVDGVSTV